MQCKMSKLDGCAGKDCELFWSTGVLEYWSVGKSQSPNFNLKKTLSLLHYSTTPLLQETSASRKDLIAPSGGSSKPGPPGQDSLLTMKYAVEESAENAYYKMDSSSQEGRGCPFEVFGVTA